MNQEWVICGGGIHGVHLATRLIVEAGINREQIKILDPSETLLCQWRNRSQATGMSHLRSPSVHHLDLEPFSLQQFAHKMRRKIYRPFVAPYQRPALSLFDAHCDKLIQQYDLQALHIQEKAESMILQSNRILIKTDRGQEILADRLILALGSGEKPAWPEACPQKHARIQHIFSAQFTWPSLQPEDPVLVVGGGITAGQVALKLVRQGQKVHVISRHPIREHQFDSDPGWLGPKYLQGFQRETCMNRRRRSIDSARHRGSMPGDVRRAVLQEMKKGSLHWHQGTIQHWQANDREISLSLSKDLILHGAHCLLATGFSGGRPGGAFVDALIEALHLPTSACGFPILDRNLSWHSKIYVTGSLAELELGPVSKNIAGARMAGDRIMEGIRASLKHANCEAGSHQSACRTALNSPSTLVSSTHRRSRFAAVKGAATETA